MSGQGAICAGSQRMIEGNATSTASSSRWLKTCGQTPAKISWQRPLGVARDDEDVEPDRRRDQADLGDDDDDDAEPDRVEAERLDQRQDDRHGQDQDRDLVHQAAEDDVAEQDEGEDHPARDLQRADPLHDALGRLRQGEEVAEDLGADDDHDDHAARVCGMRERLDERARFTLPSRTASSEGAERAEPGGLGRRRDAAVDDAGDHHEEDDHRPDDLERAELLAHRVGGTARRRARVDGDQRPDRRHDRQRHQEARDHAADEQLADADVGDDSVEDERDARRDQHRQRSRDRDHAAGELGVVTRLQHRRHGRRRQRRRRRGARPRDRAEAGAGQRGRHAEAARDAADPRRRPP